MEIRIWVATAALSTRTLGSLMTRLLGRSSSKLTVVSRSGVTSWLSTTVKAVENSLSNCANTSWGCGVSRST